MAEKFPIIEVPFDAPESLEEIGSKEKFWFLNSEQRRCLFKKACQVQQRYAGAARIWLDNLAKVSNDDIVELFECVPLARISKPATEFAQKILELNQRTATTAKKHHGMKKLFLAWQDPNSRSWFPIGRLTFNGSLYQFVYTQGALEALSKSGFVPLLSLPNLKQVYESIEMFPLFSNRLMRHSRPEYKNFVQWLNLPQNADDPIAILARSGGRKATDNFEVFPCPEVDDNGLYHIHFFARGLRHLPQCSTERINSFKPNEMLCLAHEFQNPYDDKALTLNTQDHHIIGYCPRYLVQDFFEVLKDKPNLVKVHVERVNPPPTPLQFRLLCNITAEWGTSFRPFSSAGYQPIVDVESDVSLKAS